MVPKIRYTIIFLFCDSALIARSGKCHVLFSFAGCALQTWKLKRNTAKTVQAVFDSNNKEAKPCHFAPSPNTSE